MPRLFVAEPQPLARMPQSNPNVYGAQIGAEMEHTGRLTQALGQVLNEYADSQSRAAAVHYEQDLKAAAIEISRDPDIAGRGDKFDVIQKQIFDARTPKLGNRNEYEARAGLATNDVRNYLIEKTHNDATTEMRANNDLELDHYATKAANAGSMEESISYLRQAEESAGSAGLYRTPSEIEAKAQETLTHTIGLAALKNPALASSLYDSLGHMLTPEAQVSLGKVISTEGVESDAQAVADKAVDTLGGGASITSLLSYARENSSGAVRTGAENRLRMMYTASEQARGDRQRDKAQQAFATVEAVAALGVDNPKLIAIQRDLLRKNITYDPDIDASTASAILTHFDNALERKPEVTDPNKWSELWKLRTSDPAAFSKVNLPALRMSFKREDYNEIEQEQKDVLAGGVGSKTSPSGMGAIEVGQKVAKQAGITDKGKLNDFSLRSHEAITARRNVLKRDLTFEEKESAAREVLKQIEVPDAGFLFFDGTKRIGELTASDRKEIIGNPPADLLNTTRSELAKRGIPNPSDDDVIEAIDDYLDLNGVPRE